MYDFKTTEAEILKFWEEKKIYEKSKKKNSKGKKFYMMDGPPYATGHIHMGTALNKILKDIAMRSRRLQGFDVFDRAGYDTHGVPIEFQIEKEIGSKSKQDIEKYGVKNFIEKCKKFATQYIDVMNFEFRNLGVWMNFEDPYLTLSNEYVETIWDTFKVADKKGLLYLGKYPVHICPRCETAVAYNEIEYSKQEDTSVFVKFPLVDKKNTFLIIWTTTPWTLPANTGVMVHPDYEYQEVEVSNGERWVLAKELVPKVMMILERGYTPIKEFKGKEMNKWKYKNPLYKNLKLNTPPSYNVVLSARYVNLEDGSGLVHCAPGHGKEDYEVGKETGLEIISPVGINGLLTEETGKYSGKKARVVDEEIIKDLEEDGSLIYKFKYSHDYPLCWRCKSPLLMIAQPQWFLKISDIQKKMLKENEEVNWVPSWMKQRMNAWLEGISDWPVSRRRYWGTPLPIWKCEKCENKIVIGSLAELEKLSRKKIKDVHKPEIDEVFIPCKCRGKMKRVSDVLDVWFDSGVSSWAALDKNQFKKFWPADLNIEGTDQVRGWWNSQMILSQIKFDKKPFDNILVHGMVLDLGKVKMSKSLGNIITPHEIIEKYGRDYLRYYFAKSSKGEDFAFDEKEFANIQSLFRVLTNINTFVNQLEQKKSKQKIEDKWILSRFNSVLKETIESYNKYKFNEAVSTIEKFLIFDLSKNYVQIIRERSDEVYDTMNYIRIEILKLLAPVIPILTEKIWQELKERGIVKEESIHLTSWPKYDEKAINKKLEEEFKDVMEILEKGFAERDKIQIGLKWPLAKAEVKYPKSISKDLQEIILRQLNIKKIELKKSERLSQVRSDSTGSQVKETEVKYDTIITSELEAEGYAREMSRHIQAFRKKLGLEKTQVISSYILTDDNTKKILEKNKKFIAERTNSKTLEFVTTFKETFKNKTDFKIKDKKGEMAIIFG